MSAEDFTLLGLPRALAVLVIAALPISELRGAIPVAINLFHFPWYYALGLAVIGNMLPVPFILLLFGAVARLLEKVAFLRRPLHWFYAYTRRRGTIAERYQLVGLSLFVAVPLPFTGAWTGSLIAVLFGLSFGRAFLSILLGVCIAGVIVTCLSLLGWVGAAIAGVGLAALAVSGLWKASK